MLILISFVDKWVKYNDTILGSEGRDLKPFFAQNKPKSLKEAIVEDILDCFELTGASMAMSKRNEIEKMAAAAK